MALDISLSYNSSTNELINHKSMTKKKKTPKDIEPKDRSLSTKDNYWNRFCNRQSQYSDQDYDTQQHDCKIGIYGWRKKFLYILIILIAALVILNAALTLWIISVLNFSFNGLANMRIDSDGITLNGNAFIDDHLFATTISSRKDQSLKLISDNNITLNAWNSTDGKISNKISIENSRLTAIANDFRIKGTDGRLLFRVDEDRVTIAADTVQVENLSGLRFERSLLTPLVQAIAHSDLKLISPERRVSIKAPKSVAMESRLGDVSAICLEDLRLKSKRGKITLESSDIELRNLKTAIPKGKTTETTIEALNLYPIVYQLCVCADSGKIFTAPADKRCVANETICGPKHTSPSSSRSIIS